MVRGEFPYFPAPGSVNALPLNHRASGWAADAARAWSLPDVLGSPVTLGRCRPPNRPRFAPDVSPLITAFNGGPLTSSTTAHAFQPPNSRYAGPRVFFGPRSSTLGATTLRCCHAKLLIQ